MTASHWARRAMLKARALFDRRSVERELDDELRFHIEREVAERVRLGMPPDEARRTALRDFGGVERFKEDCRDERGTRPLEDVGRDVRYALRSLRRNPSFTAIAVLTLALGIGANTAIFSVVNGVLLRPLPYPNPDRVVGVWNEWEGQPAGRISPAEFFDYVEGVPAFEHFGVYASALVTLTGDGEPERVPAVVLSSGVFPALGVAPVLGRAFTAAEDRPGAEDVVLLGDGLWRRRFGGAPSIIGRRITLGGRSSTVIGVMPPGFRLPDDLQSSSPAEMYLPAALDRDSVVIRGSHYLFGVARLRPGATAEQATTALRGLASRFARDYPKDYPEQMRFTARTTSLRDDVVGEIRPALLVLLGAVGFVLLIACANMANLLLSRAEGRQREIAVRTALGADRFRLVRQLLVESMLLALIGGVLGAALAAWGTRALVALRPPNVPRLDEIGVDLVVLGFALLVSLITGLAFGLVPALQASRVDPQATLRDGSRGATAGGGRLRLRRALVVSEVSLALVLLLGAGLLTKSFVKLLGVDPGFSVENVLTTELALPASQYPEEERVVAFFDEVRSRIGALPGVIEVGGVAGLPLATTRGDIGIEIEGREVPTGESRPRGDWQVVTPGYFRALGMRLLRGREIEASDRAGSPGVVVINESMARKYWPDGDAIGARFKLGGGAGPGTVTVVGIVGDVRHSALAAEPEAEMYLAHTQFRFWGGGSVLRALTLVVRTSADPAQLGGLVRREVAALDASLPLGSFRTMEEVRGESVARPRFMMMLLSTFSAVAFAIALIGIYGVMAYSVVQRRKEIGIRVALGARPGAVASMIVRQGVALALIGIAVGLVAAFALTRLLSGMLFSVSPTDPATLLVVSLSLAAAAIVACWIPARRATKVDPIEALRAE